MNKSSADGMLVIGKITGCYGLKGWMKVHSYTEPPENFLGFGGWQLKRRGGYETVNVDSGKPHGRGLVVHIAWWWDVYVYRLGMVVHITWWTIYIA